MVADLAKQVSDDDTLTYRHIAFLLNIYRAYLLKQKYLNKAQEIPQSNYQTVCAKVEPTNNGSPGNPCCNSKCNPDSSYMLKSSNKLSEVLTFGDTKATLVRCAGEFTISIDAYNNLGESEEEREAFCEYFNNLVGDAVLPIYDDLPKTIGDLYSTKCKEDVHDTINMIYTRFPKYWKLSVYQIASQETSECNPDMYDATMRTFGNVQIVSKERFPYAGLSKYSRNQVFGTIGIDNKLYLKSNSDITSYTTAFITSIFENPDKAYEQSSCTYEYTEGGEKKIKTCPEGDGICDPWDREFPIEEALQSQLVNLVLRDILGAAYRGKDDINNSSDDLSDIVAYVRRNMKQQYVNQQNPSNGTAE